MHALESSLPPDPPEAVLLPGVVAAAVAHEGAEPLMIARLADEDHAGAAAWDDFVRATPGSSFCHLSGWRRVVRESLGLESVYLHALRADGSLAGVLPLVRIRSALFGHSLVSVPYLNEGGPLGTPYAQRVLLDHAVEEARLSRAGLLELRSRHALPQHEEYGAARRKITVLLELAPTADELFTRRFTTKLRTKIRRAQKEGLEVRFGPDQRAAFYHVLARKLRDLGTPVHPRRFFEAIAREFPDLVQFCAAYAGRDIAAAGCGFFWNGEFEITWSGQLDRFRKQGANMTLYWALMQEAIRRGATMFNFGRCTPEGGTHEFKRQWGGYDIDLPWVQSPGGGATAPSAGDGGAMRLATSVWKGLPIPLANTIGPMLARRIPTY